jgi:NAD+ synthetase
MKENLDYGEVFEKIVQKTSEYLINNNIKAQILGISGGIDSTVCAAICHEVSKRTNIPLIGRSLPTAFNKKDEINSADLVGKAFCDDYKEVNIQNWYTEISDQLFCTEKTPRKIICNGNIQARLRMMYLYDLAGNNDGIVIDTDNLTENNLGYYTIHGDVGDFNPIGGLWKTEVFKLAEWLFKYYQNGFGNELHQAYAAKKSIELKPTAGLGITDSDLDEIGAESYEQVDSILREILAWKWLSLEKRGDTYNSIWDMRNAFLEEQQMLDTPIEVIIAVTDRHFKSEFKRKKLPIKINRDEII